MQRMIFISHRHDDKPIADVFNRHFQLWGISQNEIFQSSDQRGGLAIGDTLTEGLRAALSKARMVLLIYTSQEKDWSWCMYECGVATNPDDNTQSTKVIVFRTGQDVPAVFKDKIVFGIDKEDIAKFTTQFHTKEGFVIEGETFAKDTAQHILDEKGTALYEDLKDLKTGKKEERYRWDFFTLRLDQDTLPTIQDEDNLDRKIEIIMNAATVRRDFGEALKHFNYQPNTRGLKLINLINRWKDEMSSEMDETAQKWVRELCIEMNRATKNQPSKPTWDLMKSRHYPDWWFYPVVNHVRVETDGSIEFDIYMYRFPGRLPHSLPTEG